MKYFLDTEFIEGTQKKWFGQPKPTIDLISIGIVCEDGREYYAISKDFNLKEAWNSFQRKEQTMFEKQNAFKGKKEYWIRDNVLKSIYTELEKKEIDNYKGFTDPIYDLELSFNYSCLKRLIKKYGKSNKQIAEEIKDFCLPSRVFIRDWYENKNGKIDTTKNFQYLKDYEESFEKEYNNYQNPQFYGYYADYDWVVFCWLFGKMNNLPKGFPMYCVDLKQELDKKVNSLNWLYCRDIWSNSNRSIKTIGKGQQQEKDRDATFEEKIKIIKELVEYPKQTNEHNALADAIFCKDSYNFLNSI